MAHGCLRSISVLKIDVPLSRGNPMMKSACAGVANGSKGLTGFLGLRRLCTILRAAWVSLLALTRMYFTFRTFSGRRSSKSASFLVREIIIIEVGFWLATP